MSEALLQLAQAVTKSDGLESLTRPLLELLESVTGLESTYLTDVDEAAGRQRVRFARNTGSLQIPEGVEVDWDEALCRRSIEQGVAYTDAVPALWGDSVAARELGITTYLSTPVHAPDGRLIGTLCAASRERRPLRPDATQVLALFGRLIAQQLEREQLLQRLQSANDELNVQATTDALTGLPNRRAVREALQGRLREAALAQRQLHVGFVDLDDFKAINDQHGHELGDRFLRAMAARLLATMRSGDLVGRYGGDEFVAIFDAPADAGATAQHLRERLEACSRGRFDLGETVLDYAGASVGVVSSGVGETDVDALIARADAAMYGRKQARREGTGRATT